MPTAPQVASLLAAGNGEATQAFVELGVVVLVLALLARLAHRFGLSPVPLYLLAGLAISGGGIVPIEVSNEFVDIAGEIGVLLLLFTLGLEFSSAELSRELRRGTRAGVVDLVLNGVPGVAAGLLLGWEPLAAVLLGGITYISSSGVISKLLGDLGRIGNRETPSVLSVLVLEDLAMVLYLPIIGVGLSGASLGDGAADVAVAVSVVVAVLVGAARLGPHLSRAVTSSSDEVLLLTVVGLILLVGGLVQRVDISAAVGAFLVGVALSGSVQRRSAALVGPLRDLFAAVFFFLFALRVEPTTLPPVLLPALALAAVGVVTKLVTGWYAAGRAGVGPDGRWRAGTSLIARGEFSIVIAGLGVAAGVEPELGPLAAAYVLVLAIVGPLLARRRRAPHRLRVGGRSPVTRSPR
jgi:monovalent cation:H+ antiporter-2, CPA2 family